MEATPRRALSGNSDLTNSSSDISSPLSISKQLWTSEDMKSNNLPTPGDCVVTHSLSMDDARVKDQNSKKKDSSFFKGMQWMFGSLTNMASKIPTFVSGINNPLSVTVVANQGVIFPDLKEGMDMITQPPGYISKNNIAQIYNRGTVITNNWMKSRSQDQESYDLNRAIQESLKQLNTEESLQKANKDVDEIDFVLPNSRRVPEIYQNSEANCQKVQSLGKSPENCETSPLKVAQRRKSESLDVSKIHENMKNFNENNSKTREDMVTTSVPTSKNAKVVSAKLDSVDCEIPSKRPHLSKTRKRMNVVVRGRGKARLKYQLRKSRASQLKHRKERTKHNLYSNIQDDLDEWENESWEESSTKSAEQDLGTQYERRPDNSTFVDSSITEEGRGLFQPSWQVAISPDKPEDGLPPISCEFRQRLGSESSIDSDDSCLIVFQDGTSDSNCDSDDSEESSSEEEETEDEDDDDDEDDEHETIQKVRFNLQPTIHTMIQWNFAYRAARKGPWEEMARDRDRFRVRINRAGPVLDPILTAQHRECIWQDRFATDD